MTQPLGLESSEGLFTLVSGGWCWLLSGTLAGTLGQNIDMRPLQIALAPSHYGSYIPMRQPTESILPFLTSSASYTMS